MSGYSTILKIRRLEEHIDKLGFMFAAAAGHGHGEIGNTLLCLKPKDSNAVPIYSRDAVVFTGNIDGLEIWLRGIEWARNYDFMLGVSTDKKRDRKEQDLRNKNTLSRVRGEVVVQQE